MTASKSLGSPHSPQAATTSPAAPMVRHTWALALSGGSACPDGNDEINGYLSRILETANVSDQKTPPVSSPHGWGSSVEARDCPTELVTTDTSALQRSLQNMGEAIRSRTSHARSRKDNRRI